MNDRKLIEAPSARPRHGGHLDDTRNGNATFHMRIDSFGYLNDSHELIYAWNAFVSKLGRLSSEAGEYSEAYAAQLKALEFMNATDLMIFDDSMFVACFTELGDVLSQWSRYGANGHGIALGFDSERRRNRNGRNGVTLLQHNATAVAEAEPTKSPQSHEQAMMSKAQIQRVRVLPGLDCPGRRANSQVDARRTSCC